MNKEQKEFFKTKPHLTKVMSKMCSYVGAEFDKIQPKSNNWFLKYSWTKKQQEDFRKWLIKYLTNNISARRELLNNSFNSKKYIERAVDEFIFMYGWKNKE